MGTVRGFSVVIVVSAAFGLLGCPSKSSSGSALVGDATRGAAAVTQRACGTCHKGSDGSLSGTTTPYPGSMAYPANLTPDSETGLGDWDEATIAKAILTGVDDESEDLCPTMPHFTTMGMTDQEAHDIAAYLKSLAPVKNTVPESACPPVKGGATGAAGASGH